MEEPAWTYPSSTTNSAFTVDSPGSFPFDTDGDGLPEGSAVTSNGDVEFTVGRDLVGTVDGTPMGPGGGTSVRSNRDVMLLTYTIKNGNCP